MSWMSSIAVLAPLLLANCGDGIAAGTDAAGAPGEGDISGPLEAHTETAIAVHLNSAPPGGLVAFQDGNGEWQQAPLVDSANTTSFSVHWSRYAVAWSCIEPDRGIGEVNRSGILQYRNTDETPEITDTAFSYTEGCRPDLSPGAGEVTTTCTDGLATSEWATVPGASTYSWTMVEHPVPLLVCGTTHAPCVYSWRASFSASVLGESPRFRQPPLASLAAWPQTTRYGCDGDGTYTVNVTTE